MLPRIHSSWAFMLALSGCEPEPIVLGGPEDEGERPRETPWMTIVDALPFPAEISTLTIGRHRYDDNFANSGDVEVYFDQDLPVITVAMRVYDFADKRTFLGDDEVEGTMNRMHLWAYATPGDPKRPGDMPAQQDCTVGAWKDGCKIHLFYDGLFMPLRSGADLRVHLPRSYRGRLAVVTDDNHGEPDYPRLGDVVIDGLCGSGEVALAEGSAAIKLCRELSPAPTCPVDQVAACEAIGWSPLCPCAPESYGALRIEAEAPSAANITVDMPDSVWASVTLDNQDPEQADACMPEITNCGESCVLGGDSSLITSAEYNDPGPDAPAGGGYQVVARSARCGPVELFASPGDYIDELSEPMVEQHGHIRVCTDCL